MTDDERAPDEVRRRAVAFTDTPALLADPVPVRDPRGRLYSWFVPLVDGDGLVGFVELLPDLTHRRSSTFATGRGGPPSAASWLDPAVVAARAGTELDDGEVAGAPQLSFDAVPDRLAWAVPVGGPRGPRIVYVAGDSAWSGPAATGLG